MIWLRRIALALLGRYGTRLRYPHLLLLAGLCFGLDLVIPDVIPFLDEIGLGLLTLLFASWKKKEADPEIAMDSDERSGPTNTA